MRSSSLGLVCNNAKSIQTKEKKKEIYGELEEEKVSLNILPVDVYDDPKLEESIVATINENDKEIVKNVDKSLSVAKKVEKPTDKVLKIKNLCHQTDMLTLKLEINQSLLIIQK